MNSYARLLHSQAIPPVLLLAACALFGPASFGSPSYTITDLGTLGGAWSGTVNINNSSVVIGNGPTATGEVHAWRYAGVGPIADLGGLPGSTLASVSGINDSGQIVGRNRVAGRDRAVLYAGNTVYDLGLAPGYLESGAVAINTSGTIVGEVYGAPSPNHAAIFSAGSVADIGTLPGSDGSYSVATDINDSNVVVGSSVAPGGQHHAFVYSSGVMSDLNSLANLAGSNFTGLGVAAKINNAGQIIGHGGVTNGATHAFLYQSGQVIDLGSLASDSYSYGLGVNSTGDVVGYSYLLPAPVYGVPHAFIYTKGVMRDLNSLVDLNGTGLAYLSGASEINDRGEIACRGFTTAGEERSLLLTPIATPSAAKIIAVSIPVGSQGYRSRPGMDNVWAQSAPIDTSLGIGIVLKLALPPGHDEAEFAMHQNGSLFPTVPPYLAPNLPNPASTTVSYTFSAPVVVSGVRIVQHVWGITRVSGALGSGPGSMVPLGNVFGPSGDIVNSFQSDELAVQDFHFNNTSVAGTRFELSVTKTSHFDAFATYRIYPLDPAGRPIMTETVLSSNPPTAVAGSDQTIRVGTSVALDGRGSFDDETASTALIYAWSLVSRPAGSSAALTGETTATPGFVADVAGTYDLQLVVTDEDGLASAADHVIVSANRAPTAVASVDITTAVIGGDVMHFNGTASFDPEGDPLSYAWTITAKPAGSLATLSGATSATPLFAPDVAGTYEVSLTVSDFIGPSAPQAIRIHAITAVEFAQQEIGSASTAVSVLTAAQVTTQGNKNALLNFLSQATVALQQGDVVGAIGKLRNAIERTDGCALRGIPDGNGPAKDWITDCTAQTQTYTALKAALDALTR